MEQDHNSFGELPLMLLDAPTKAVPAPKSADYRKNHRQRLRQRFMQGGAAALPDYELLELVLFRAIPRQDVKPLAKLLLNEFGDFNRAISASPEHLRRIGGVGEAVVVELKLVEAAAQRLAQARILNQEVLSSWDALIDYCTASMAHRLTEQFRILFLDRKNVLIADEEQQTGTVDHVPVYPREVAKRALELDSSALILVHNHPSGDPSPSDADIQMTQRIEAALTPLNIVLHDHIIIGKNQHVSFRDKLLI